MGAHVALRGGGQDGRGVPVGGHGREDGRGGAGMDAGGDDIRESADIYGRDIYGRDIYGRVRGGMGGQGDAGLELDLSQVSGVERAESTLMPSPTSSGKCQFHMKCDSMKQMLAMKFTTQLELHWSYSKDRV